MHDSSSKEGVLCKAIFEVCVLPSLEKFLRHGKNPRPSSGQTLARMRHLVF